MCTVLMQSGLSLERSEEQEISLTAVKDQNSCVCGARAPSLCGVHSTEHASGRFLER